MSTKIVDSKVLEQAIEALGIGQDAFSQAFGGYGFYRPDNPHNFSPDFECCTPEEIANHSAACEAYDKGTYVPDHSDGWIAPGVHVTSAPWGIGTYTDECKEIEEAITSLRAALNAQQAEPVKYGCHFDLLPGKQPDVCVIDENRPWDCVHSGRRFSPVVKKEGCEWWKQITHPAPATPAVPTPTAALNEAMNDEKLNPWKRALIDLNVVCWSYKKEHDNDPRAALYDLLAANTAYAADPQVSEIAAKNVNEAIAQELERMAAESPFNTVGGSMRRRANELRGK